MLLTGGGQSPLRSLSAWCWPCWPRCAARLGGNARTPERPVGCERQMRFRQYIHRHFSFWFYQRIYLMEDQLQLTCNPQIWEHISGSESWIRTGWLPRCWKMSIWSGWAWQILPGNKKLRSILIFNEFAVDTASLFCEKSLFWTLEGPSLTFHESCVGAAVVIKVSAVQIVQAVISQAVCVAETLKDAVHETLQGETNHCSISCNRKYMQND